MNGVVGVRGRVRMPLCAPRRRRDYEPWRGCALVCFCVFVLRRERVCVVAVNVSRVRAAAYLLGKQDMIVQ